MQIFISAKLLYMFRASIALISGVHKTVVAASGTDCTIWGTSFLKRDHLRTQSLFGHAVINTAETKLVRPDTTNA